LDERQNQTEVLTMEATLQASRRTTIGRGEAGRLRRTGQIPAVVYGGSTAPTESITVDPKALMQILRSSSGMNTLIALDVPEVGQARVLVKAYQVDPVHHQLLHVDFYRVAMDKVLRVTVPVHLTGEAKGVKTDGGILDFVHREIAIECLPGDIPGQIVVDVSELGLHDGVRVRDLTADPRWKFVSEPDTLIVHVITVKAEPEPAAAEAATVAAATPATPAEPEVIKKGKVEKEEEE
jgi:large subunit ribosomal protein L25